MELIIGFMAAFVTSSAQLPQLRHVLKYRCAKDLSYAWLCIHITGASSWCAYGLLTDKLPLVCSGGLVSLSLLTILIMKIYYDRLSVS